MSQPEYLGTLLQRRAYDYASSRMFERERERKAHNEDIKKQLAEMKKKALGESGIQPAQPVNLRSEQKNYTIVEEAKKRAVENSSFMNNRGELELPEEIKELIDNPNYERKFKFLAREWGMKLLLIAVEISKGKEKPSHYFARMTAKANREGTRSWLMKLRDKRERLAQRLEKLGADLKYLPYAMRAETQLGIKRLEELFRMALKAEAPAHYFAVAVSNELKS